MIRKRFERRVVRKALALALAVTFLGRSWPLRTYAEPEKTERNRETVEALLSDGEYEEGRVLVLYDRFADAAWEELVGGAGPDDIVSASLSSDIDEESVLSHAVVVDQISAESYVEATGDSLPAVFPEELVGAAGSDETENPELRADRERISILLVEDHSRTTRELLSDVLNEEGVLYAQPNYVRTMDSAGNSEDTLQIPGNDTVGSAEEINSHDEMPEEVLSENLTEPEDGNTASTGEGNKARSGSDDDILIEGEDKNGSAGNDDSAHAENVTDTEKDSENDKKTESKTDQINSHTGEDPAEAADLPDEDVSGGIENSPENRTDFSPVNIPDFTGWQWEYIGDALIPETEYNAADLYNVHTPSWNKAGAVNADGVVMVIDTGVDYDHPDLKEVMYEFSPELQNELGCGPYGVNTSGTGNPKDPMDHNDHGTHCAGIIAGAWNGFGVSGMASGCRIAAVRVLSDQGKMSDLAVLRAMAFTADAADAGVDIRVTSNSYGGPSGTPLMGMEIAELEKRGIVCVYSSGNDNRCNDIQNVTQNQIVRASNTVVVNASTPVFRKASFSNYGPGMTDVYAPGVGILSAVSTQADSDEDHTYFASLDPEALYYNTSFDSVPDLEITGESQFRLSSYQAIDSYSYDGDGRSMQIRVDEVEDEVVTLTFALDIPVGTAGAVSYESMALYGADGQYTFSIRRGGMNKAGETEDDRSSLVQTDGNWILLSCSTAPEKTAKGCVFPLIRSEDDTYNYVQVLVDVYKESGNFEAGDCIYLDQVGAGINANALLPYAYWDGTSMACPHVSAEAAILYTGRERSKVKASEVAGEIRSKVVASKTLNDCTSHGTIDLTVTEDRYPPVVLGASVDKKEKTITITGHNFDRTGHVFLAGSEAEALNWDDERIVIRCPDPMRSGILNVTVQTEVGIGTGSFLLYAPDASSDSAAPLYESDIPDIPAELFPDGCMIAAAVGINDYLYCLVEGEIDHHEPYVTKIIRYSIQNETWEKVADTPYSFFEISAVGYRGKLYVSGSYYVGKDRYTSLFSYSPSTGKWRDLEWGIMSGGTLVNFRDNIYVLGGYYFDDKEDCRVCSTDIKLLIIEDSQEKKVGELKKGVLGAFAATDKNAIYLEGGYGFDGKDPRPLQNTLQKITFTGEKAVTTELGPLQNTACFSYPVEEVITGYQGVYLTGYSGVPDQSGEESDEEDEANAGESEPGSVPDRFKAGVLRKTADTRDVLSKEAADIDSGSSGVPESLSGASAGGAGGASYVDADGNTVLDADTFILSGESYVPYGRRISHDILGRVISAEYKGEIFAFGWSVFDGEKYINLASRKTALGESDAPCWDTFKIKIPKAVDGLVYSGEEQTGVPESEEGYYTITGNRGTEAGTYSATLVLTDPDWCVWEDGTVEDKIITWKIDRQAEEITPTVIPGDGSKNQPGRQKGTAGAVKKGTNTTNVKSYATQTKTGDTSRPVLWIAAFAAAVAVIYLIVKRRKK